jgi:hypothetical protein
MLIMRDAITGALNPAVKDPSKLSEYKRQYEEEQLGYWLNPTFAAPSSIAAARFAIFMRSATNY